MCLSEYINFHNNSYVCACSGVYSCMCVCLSVYMIFQNYT